MSGGLYSDNDWAGGNKSGNFTKTFFKNTSDLRKTGKVWECMNCKNAIGTGVVTINDGWHKRCPKCAIEFLKNTEEYFVGCIRRFRESREILENGTRY